MKKTWQLPLGKGHKAITTGPLAVALLACVIAAGCSDNDRDVDLGGSPPPPPGSGQGGGQAETVTITEGTDLDADLSPDQSTLIFGLQNGLWRMAGDGGQATRLNDPEQDFVRPDWSPDGERIVFQGYTDNNYHILTMAPDGSDVQPLTSGQYDDRGPVYSPDGTRIAFASDRNDDPTTKGNSNIWVLDIASGDLTQWTDDPESEYQPAWSPDGTRIAYTVSSPTDLAAGDGQYSIQATDAAGNTSVLIRHPSGQINAPAWAPDGSRIAYTLLVDGNNHLYVDDTQVSDEDEDVFQFRPRWLSDSTLLYTSNGKIQRRDLDGDSLDAIAFEARISFDRKTYSYKKHEYGADRPPAQVKGIVTPAISPDGNRVAFVALNDLWVMDIGGTPEQITDDQFTELQPTWSPDGQSLAYSSDRDGIEQIYIRNMDSGDERVLASFAGAEYAAKNQYRASWCPTGNRIVFQTGRGVFTPPITYVADVDSGDVTAVDALSQQFEAGRPSWGPSCSTLAMAALNAASVRFRQGWNHILVVDVNSGETRQMPPDPDDVFSNINQRDSGNGPVWSPDGQFMAYNGGDGLYLLPVGPAGEAAGSPQLVTDENADYISWRGDSQQLMYVSDGVLRTIAASGGSPQTVPVDLSWTPQLPEGRTIVHAGQLWDGASQSLRSDVDIELQDERIVAIRDHEDAAPADNVRYVDASNPTVMPGLTEGHMHREWVPYVGARLGRQLLSYGITSVVSLGDPAYRSQARKEALEAGKLVGPRAFTTGGHINGSRIYYGFMRTTSNEKMFTNELSRIFALDMDQLKTYVRLPFELQLRANDAAHERGLPTFSHYFYPSLGFGQDDMSHLSATQRWEFSHTKSLGGHTYQDVIDLATASKMAITNTPFASSTLFNEHPEDINDRRITTLFMPWQLQSLQDTFDDVTSTDQSVAREGLQRESDTLHKILQGGGSVWAGTDEPLVHVAQSLHQTLESQVQFGGFTPYESLRTATVAPTRDVGRGGDLGTLEPGKLADLSFVEGNPLEDIRAAANVQMVMVGGHLYTIDDLLEPFAGSP